MTGKGTASRLIGSVLKPWWRLTRGLTLGVQGVIVDGASRVLLVRHGYRPGWFFPGGGVERGETLNQALVRELREEAGVVMTAQPALHGVFSNSRNFPGDHIALFVVREWEQPEIPASNPEIAEQGLFDIEALPRETEAGTRRRLAEIFRGRSPEETW